MPKKKATLTPSPKPDGRGRSPSSKANLKRGANPKQKSAQPFGAERMETFCFLLKAGGVTPRGAAVRAGFAASSAPYLLSLPQVASRLEQLDQADLKARIENYVAREGSKRLLTVDLCDCLAIELVTAAIKAKRFMVAAELISQLYAALGVATRKGMTLQQDNRQIHQTVLANGASPLSFPVPQRILDLNAQMEQALREKYGDEVADGILKPASDS